MRESMQGRLTRLPKRNTRAIFDRMATGGSVVILASLMLLPGHTAAAKDSWLRDGVAAPKAANMAQSRGFAAMQIATDKPDQLMANWGKPGAVFDAGGTTKAVRNRPIVTFIVFRGCRADRLGHCNVVADFETTGPSGKLYDRSVGTKIWTGRPPPPGYDLELSEGGLGLRIENKDLLGSYRVRATVKDKIAGIVLHTEQVLTATEK